jgi:hypothetical protein
VGHWFAVGRTWKKLRDRRNTNRLEVCGPPEGFISPTLTKQMENKKLRFGYLFVYLIYPVDNVVGSSE